MENEMLMILNLFKLRSDMIFIRPQCIFMVLKEYIPNGNVKLTTYEIFDIICSWNYPHFLVIIFRIRQISSCMWQPRLSLSMG